MESFDLAKEFDVITCLFRAIGYVRTLPALEATLRNFARHLRPGGYGTEAVRGARDPEGDAPRASATGGVLGQVRGLESSARASSAPRCMAPSLA